MYAGSSKRRLWDGREAVCYEFQRPHGRPLSLLRGQIVEARPATLNDRGQLVLVEDAGPAPDAAAQPRPREAAWSPPPWSAG